MAMLTSWRKCLPVARAADVRSSAQKAGQKGLEVYGGRADVGCVTHAVVRDQSTGVVIHDSAGSTQFDSGRLSRAFKVPRNVDVIAEINMAEEPSAQPTSWEETELGPREASEYRAAAARLNYLALDRPDILFASKECSRRMSAPRNGDWTAIKRVVRYLLGKPRMVWKFKWQEGPKFVSAFSDSNWAGCHDTRKSTSGACIMNGSHLIKAYSRTQSNIALSSGEADFYALVPRHPMHWA